MNNTTREPETIDQNGNAPDTRFSSYAGLFSAYQESKREHQLNDVRFTSIRGIYDRKPPEDPAYLRAQGMEDMPNFNIGEFTSKVDSYVSTWVDHNTGGYKFYGVKLKRNGEVPPEVWDVWDEKVSDFFNEAITEWEDDSETQSAAAYILESCIRDVQMGLFGLGLPMFRDDTDWRFVSIPTRKVYVPQGTKLTLSNCPVMFVDSETTVTGLYQLVKKAPDDAGWNKQAVWDMLYQRTSEQRTNGVIETYADWENRMRNNDVFITSNFSPVLTIDCYVQEFTDSRKKNGVSHYIIPRGTAPTDILFKKEKRYKSFRSFIIPFSDNSGPEGDWHGVKGFGDAIYDPCHFNNQFFNHAARCSLIANMPMWKAGEEADRDKLSQIKWTMNGIINPGINMEQLAIRTDLNGMMAIFGASQRMVNSNSRMFPTGESIGQEAKTATQSTFDRQDQAKLSSLQIKFYRMVCLDSLGAEMYRRLAAKTYPENLPGGRAAASFREKCKELGIPPEVYSKPLKVEADRSGGTGNQALDLMVAKEVFAVASPGRGQLNARRGIVKTLVGSDRVEEYVQAEFIPQEQQGIVNLENSDLASGQTFEPTPDQEPLIHLGAPSPDGKGHLGLLISTLQVATQISESKAVEQNLDDAQKVERALEAILTHSAAHNQILASFNIEQYKEIAKQNEKLLNDCAQFIETFRRQIGAALQNQQQAQPQMSAKDQATLISAQVKAEVARAEAQQRMQLAEQSHLQKMGNLAERSSFKTEAEWIHFQHEMERKQAEVMQEMGITQAKADQQMGQEAMMTLAEMERAAAETANTRAAHNAEQVSQ